MKVSKYTVAITKQGIDRPGKDANPARGQLNREINISLSPYASACPFFMILGLNLVLTHGSPPDFRGSDHLFI